MTAWECLQSSNDEWVIRHCNDLLSWLDEISDNKSRRALKARLQGNADNEHYSARMELFFHHYFFSPDFQVTIHPDLPNTNHKPEFLVESCPLDFIFEAKVSEEQYDFKNQKTRSEELKKELQKIDLPFRISFMLEKRTPPELPLKEIREWLEIRLHAIHSGSVIIDEQGHGQIECQWVENYDDTWHFRHRSKYKLTPYEVNFDVTPSDTTYVNYTTGGTSGAVNDLWRYIEKKATEYGERTYPFVIGLWPRPPTNLRIEKDFLLGQMQYRFQQSQEGYVKPGSAGFTTAQNGIFTMAEHGILQLQQVSAVVIYSPWMQEKCLTHFLRVYHHPYAIFVLDQAVFEHYPQLVPSGEEDGMTSLEWIASNPKGPAGIAAY